MKLRRSGWLKPIAPTLGVLFATALLLALNVVPRGGETAQAGPPPDARDPVEVATALSDAFSQVADRVLPAVVTITSEKVISTGPLAGMRGQGFPDLFDNFFGPFRRQTPQTPQEYRQRGLGSGFIISSDGTILTANHVVQDAEKVQVRLSDDRELTAEVVGTDPKTDVAVLRVKADSALPSIPLGDSDALRVGEWVIALGNPFGEGLRGTVTAGIVSAKGRSRIGLTDYEDFIQTDAAINPGNSGGPLLDMSGAVIAINSAINPQANTIGFAVPINIAKEILPQLKANGAVTRGWLGVSIQEVTPELASALKLDVKEGALVAQTNPGGPADKAGIQRGDVIQSFAGKPVGKPRDLSRAVASTGVGKSVEVVVLRDGKPVTLQVAIEKQPGTPEQEARGERKETAGAAALGLEIGDLDDELRQQLGLKDAKGVVIAGVEPGSPAADAGLRPGDLVLEVDRKPVENAAGLEKQLAAGGDSILFLVRRGDGTLFIAVNRKG